MMNNEEFPFSLEAQQKRQEEKRMCRELAEKITEEGFNVIPVWHLSLEHIDFTHQVDILDNDYLTEGYTLIQAYGISKLFNKLGEQGKFLQENDDIFFEGEFAENSFCRIINRWKNNEPTIPATIIIPNNTDYLFAIDGKHRLKLANYFGAETVPIILPNKQKVEILNMLK